MKQALDYGILLRKVCRVIEFNQETWLKPCIDINTELGIKAKNDFNKDSFKLINDSVFGKTMENVSKHRDIKLARSEKQRNYLVSKHNYRTTKCFSENLLAIEMDKINNKRNKRLYLGVSVLDISKIAMYEYWHDYAKVKYGNNAKLCYTDTDSFIVHVKSENVYEDLVGDVKQRFDT